MHGAGILLRDWPVLRLPRSLQRSPSLAGKGCGNGRLRLASLGGPGDVRQKIGATLQTRYRGILFFGITALVLAGVILVEARRLPRSPLVLSTATAPPTPGPTAEPPPLQVYVTGAVARPDVYPLPQGSIVKDALLAAGGPAPDADLERINLAAPLAGGQQVYVPRQGEAASPVLPMRSETAGDGLINV
ncbi:MAG: hypothetical protein EHM56_07465, partial [Chloroflexi bacterium]